MGRFFTRTRSAVLIVIGASTAGACSDDYATLEYQLERAGNEPLPAVVGFQDGCPHFLTGGGVVFSGNQRYVSNFTVEKRCPDQPPQQLQTFGTRGRVVIRNDTAFFRDSLDNPTGHGTLSADSLVVQGARHRLTYRRR